MSVCIIYASKYGSAKKVAGLISEKLGGCDIFNIAEDSFDLSKYNFVIIGSDIRMGTVDKLITKLLFRFIKPLSERKCAYFLTCIFPENGDGYFKRNIPSQLLSEAVAVAGEGVVGLHGVLQAARLAHDRQRAVVHGVELCETAGLEAGGHEQRVRARVNAVRP